MPFGRGCEPPVIDRELNGEGSLRGLDVDFYALAGAGGFDGGEDHGEGVDVVVAVGLGFLSGAEEAEHFAEGTVLAGGGHFGVDDGEGGFGAVEAFGAGDDFAEGGFVVGVDEGALGADGAPVAVPACAAAFSAPGAAVGEMDAAGHFEEAVGGDVAFVPGALGVEFFGVDGEGGLPGEHAGHIEVMDGHI